MDSKAAKCERWEELEVKTVRDPTRHQASAAEPAALPATSDPTVLSPPTDSTTVTNL